MLQGQQVALALLETPDLRGQQALRVILETPDLRGLRAPQAQRVIQAPQDLLAALELQAILDPRDPRVLPEQLALLGKRVRQDRLERLVRQDLLVRQAQPVQ